MTQVLLPAIVQTADTAGAASQFVSTRLRLPVVPTQLPTAIAAGNLEIPIAALLERQYRYRIDIRTR